MDGKTGFREPALKIKTKTGYCQDQGENGERLEQYPVLNSVYGTLLNNFSHLCKCKISLDLT
jgi:hypothetical protein